MTDSFEVARTSPPSAHHASVAKRSPRRQVSEHRWDVILTEKTTSQQAKFSAAIGAQVFAAKLLITTIPGFVD